METTEVEVVKSDKEEPMLAEMIKKIEAIGDTNPLLSLVEFSTAFDPKTLE